MDTADAASLGTPIIEDNSFRQLQQWRTPNAASTGRQYVVKNPAPASGRQHTVRAGIVTRNGGGSWRNKRFRDQYFHPH
jgi:hypothetical protein